MVLIGYLIPVVGLAALLFALGWSLLLRRKRAGGDALKEIAGLADRGAKAFGAREHLLFDLFVLVVVGGLALADSLAGSDKPWPAAVWGVVGAGLAGFAAWCGMRVALLAASRSVAAAEGGFGPAHRFAFQGGIVAGMSVVGAGLLGLGGLYILARGVFGVAIDQPVGRMYTAVASLGGFALGAALIPLFSRAAGAVFGHGAEAGAEQLLKVEDKAPEHGVRNPAALARLAAGGVSGAATSLLAPFAGAIGAAMVLGARWITPIQHSNPDYAYNMVLLPLMLGAAGIVCALFGTLVVRAGQARKATASLYYGVLLAEVLFAAAAWFATKKILLSTVASSSGLVDSDRLFLAVGLGIAAGHVAAVLGGIARGTGAGFGALAGTAAALLGVSWVAYDAVGLYGVALAAVGLVATAGIHAAVAAYAPIAGSVRLAGAMGGLGDEARARTDAFDAAGRKAAARGRAYVAAAGAMAAVAMLAAARQQLGIPGIDLGAPALWGGVVAGLVLIGLLAVLVRSGARCTAQRVLDESKRQLKEVDGLLEGQEGAKADLAKVMAAGSRGAMTRLALPALFAVVVPLAAGLAGGHLLLGLVAGAIAGGTAIALLPEGAGGDDPRRDALSPSIVALLVLMSAVAFAFAPALAAFCNC
jgi:K(+)-stimulated pyrophosphate-energized sodium pump